MINPMTLEGKSIVVTGAGQGIGRAIAGAILDLGGVVVAMDRNAEALDELRKQTESDRLTVAVGDVTDGGVDDTARCQLGAAPERRIAQLGIKLPQRKAANDLVSENARVDRVGILGGLDDEFVEARGAAE